MQQFPSKVFGITHLAVASLSFLLSHSPLAAQPRVALPNPKLPFSLEDQASIDKALKLTEQEELSKTIVPLKVKDATLEELVAEIQRVLPAAKIIEVRDASPVHLSFELKEALVGQVLQSAAALASCELYLLPDRLLISPQNKLTREESKERFAWMPGANNLYTVGPIQRMFVRKLAENVQRRVATSAGPGGNGATAVLVGDLEPELQEMVHHLGRWKSRGMPHIQQPIIRQDTKVSVSGETHGFTLRIDSPSRSNPEGKQVDFLFTVINSTGFPENPPR
jgi:hypothetical protein